jgi:hypothetical protein
MDSTYYAAITMTGTNDSTVTASLQTAGGATFLEERIQVDGGLFFPDFQFKPGIADTTWTHVVFAFTLDTTGTSTVNVTIGNNPAEPISLKPQWQPSPATLAIGFYYGNAPEQARSANIDNVLVTGTTQ